MTRENAVKLKKDEYFIADLIGMKVSTDEGEELGTLSDVMQTGANDVYVISMTDGEEVLIPAIRDCIPRCGRRAGTDVRASASGTA